MFHEQTITGGDGEIHLARGPASGPPLLLLHGVGRSWQDFVGLMTPLAARWEVLALDFRGHGQSARTPGKYLVRDYVRDVVAAARWVDRPLVVYGHSLGALVAGSAAAELGEQVRGVVLEDLPLAVVGEDVQRSEFFELFSLLQSVSGSTLDVAQLARQLADSTLAVAGQTERVRLGDLRDATAIRFGAACLKRVDPTVWEPLLAGRWLEGIDSERQWPQMRCPVLLLQGNVALGGMLADADASRFERLVPDCTRVRLTSCGHLIHTLQGELTLRLVGEFLESLRLDPAALAGAERGT